MSDRFVILCPGQGAQFVGMGRAWFEASVDAKRTFGAADEILGDRLGAKLSELCFSGPEGTLNRTDVAQPAIYTASVACYQSVFSSAEPSQMGAVAGLSLGEYTALHLAGSIGFADGLELVTLRGRAMQDAAEASEGGMVALIGADESQAEAVCARAAEGEVLSPANFNAPGQIVLSGSKSACERAVAVATEMGLRATSLAVAGAFHSALMAPAAERLRAALGSTRMEPPRCRVISNVTGRPHAEGQTDRQGIVESIKERLVEQLTKPVLWSQGCAWLVENEPGAYHELAPGKVLTGLMRRIDRGIKVTNHDEPS